MSTKRFSFTKSLLSLVVALLAVFTLVACGEDEQALVDAAIDSVAITYATGDSESMVTQNLTFVTSVGEVTVTWESSNPAVVSNTGVVTRPATDTGVSLTATLTYGEYSRTRQYYVTVKAAEVVVDPLDALDAIYIDYARGEAADRVTVDITLPMESLGLPIAWSSTNEAVLGTDGSVARPAYGTTDQTVILTATIGGETRDFVIKVLAYTEKPATLIIQEATDSLLLAGISNGVAADIELPLTVGQYDVEVEWTSSNPEVISNAGVVTRSPEQATVVLTATLRYAGLTMHKEFEVIVLPFAPSTDVATIAEALALGEDAYVKIPDVTIVGVTTDGYMFTDGVELLFVYTGGNPPAKVVAGEVFTITGMVDYYFGSYQLNATADANKPVILVDSEAAAEMPTPREVTTSVSDYIATLPTTYTAEAPFVYDYITITGKVQSQGTGNYDTFLVNTNHDGSLIDSSANSPFKTNALMIYYKSNIAALRAFNGLEVTLNVILYSLRTDRNIFTFIFTGTEDDVQTTLDDAGIVAVAKNSLAPLFVNAYEAATTLTLPTYVLGTTIAWSSNNVLVNASTGAVTMPAAGQEDVTLTATLTRGDATDTFTVTFKVGELPVLSVLEVINTETGNRVRTTGIVTTAEYYRTFFIQDETGGIAIYTADATMLAFLTANLGKEVEVFGSRAVYSGMRQIAPTAINAVGDATMPTAVNVDAIGLNATDMLPYQGQLVTLTQLYVTAKSSDSYGNVTVTFEQLASGLTIQMKWDSRKALSQAAADALTAIAVGQLFDVTNPMAWSNKPFFYYTDTTVLTAATANDVSKVAMDAMALDFEAKYETATTLTLAATGTNGSAIAWTSSDNAVIDPTTGAVVPPVSGIVSVTLTATLTLNTTEKVVKFVIEVGTEAVAPQVADLFFSEYIEGSSNNKALEIYNPLNVSVDLSGYTVELYSNGSTTLTVAQTLTGTLLPGDVVVIVNPQANATFLALADIVAPAYPNVVSYNGDDVVLLKNGTEIIDSIGQFGVDPGTNWNVSSVATSEMTLVRKAAIKMGKLDMDQVYDPSTQWVAFPQDTSMYLGFHANELFFSEYIEGSSNNKALEIYNPTVEVIDLSTYTVELYSNGGTTAQATQALTGTLAAGDVLVIVNPSANATFLALADVVAPAYPNVVSYNGDDTVLLKNGTVVVDSIGQFGVDPGTNWNVNSVATSEMTLVRNAGILRGRTAFDAVFDPSVEWTAYPQDTSSYLGSHTA